MIPRFTAFTALSLFLAISVAFIVPCSAQPKNWPSDLEVRPCLFFIFYLILSTSYGPNIIRDI
jgi:hypothetical protein